MKVLHINSYYSNRFFYKHLYDSQIRHGIDVDVYVPVSNDFKDPNIELGSFTKVSRNHRKYDRTIFQTKHRKILKDIKEQYALEDYHIFHAHSLFSNGYIAHKINQEYNAPYIVTVRSTDLNIFFKYMVHLRKLGIKILLNSSKIIFLSTSLRDELIEKYIPINLRDEILKKSVIIPNGLDPFWLENKNHPKDNPIGKNIRIIQVGVISVVKNPLKTSKAVEILNNQGYNVTFNVVGKVEDKNIYHELIKKDYVNYYNPVPKEKLIHIYRENDIFVLPSLQETFGLVYAEALSQGLPVLYSKGQGFDNQFPNRQVGYAIEKNNEKDIADNILNVINEYADISKNAVRASGKFNWNKIAKELSNIYREIT